jgi:formate dehydrogenase
MKRNANGGYDPIDWDTAITEIASRLGGIRDEFGGDKIFYYGGGGQGNHLPGVYGGTTLSSLGVQYRSNALAQEKTGEFWVAERMLGGYNHADFEHAQVVIFLGKNPWQSHGFHRARAEIREMSKDPNRTLIVLDPKRTETADLADIHLPVKVGRDAWLLAGMVATIVQESLQDDEWIAEHTRGVEAVMEVFQDVDITDCAKKSGIDEAIIRSTARTIARADSVAVFEDLGTQMNRHSTLVSYLQRLTWMLTGNFAKPGTAYTSNGLGNIGGGTEGGKSPVLGGRIIAGIIPAIIIPDEVLADHPNRYRAMIIESANPVHSLPDSSKWRKAMRALDCSVVIDIAMTESAREADYVLPATTQYEKAEATFFNFEFPENYFHVRAPLFTPPEGVLDEAEIHARIAQALGAIPEGVEEELNAALADGGREGFRNLVFTRLGENPEFGKVAPALLYRTLGKTLPEGMQNAAALWAVCHQHAMANRKSVEAAGVTGEGMALGDNLFDAIIAGPTAVVMSKEDWSDVWQRTPGGSVNFDLPDMLEAAASLNSETPQETTTELPFLLSAGERRDFTANTIFRNPAWRRKDKDGAMYINPDDAARLNLGDGSKARISTERGALEVVVEISDRMQRGHISIPNGLGLDYPDAQGNMKTTGAAPNELTSTDLADEFVGTPWHKSVPVQVEAIG